MFARYLEYAHRLVGVRCEVCLIDKNNSLISKDGVHNLFASIEEIDVEIEVALLSLWVFLGIYGLLLYFVLGKDPTQLLSGHSDFWVNLFGCCRPFF